MTQIGRYAQIIKQSLAGYAIVQDKMFGAAEDSRDHVIVNRVSAMPDRDPRVHRG